MKIDDLSPEEIHALMLKRAQLMRASLFRRSKWFVHVTPYKSLAQIRQDNIIAPQSDSGAPAEVIQVFGDEGEKRVCWHPLGAQNVPGPTKRQPFVCFAIEWENLPQRIGIDWSVAGAHGRLADYARENRGMTLDQIFVEFVWREGAIVTYDSVSLDYAKIFTYRRHPHNPASWKEWRDASDAEIFQFGQDEILPED